MIVRIFASGLALLAVVLQLGAAEIIPAGAQWRYQKGFTEASNPPQNWRGAIFSDSNWALGSAPFYYGEALIGTALDDMRGQYTSVFLRKTFNMQNVAAVGNLELETLSDDGFIAWINGVEVARYNMPPGDIPASGSSSAALGEPIPWITTVLTNPGGFLNEGANVLAVHAFNSSLSGSSDFVFDARLTTTSDSFPPFVLRTIPAAEALVRELNTIEVAFDEAVTGVDASDLLINNSPATEVDQVSPTQFVFTFLPPLPGALQITWAANHGIVDLAEAANEFVANSWSYNLDPNAPLPPILISEFMADNEHTLNDEDGDSSDWIEIFNPNESAVDLTGWFLSNTTNNHALWRFPSISINANSYLVVFASSKNRTNPAAKLHTSFNLRKEGAYLALSDPQTNVVSAFAPTFPPQREDVSYGRDRTNPDLVGYFTTPTPGAPNTAGGPGFASDVKFSMPSRTFTAPFDLVLTTAHPNAVIRYVTGKTELPTESSPIYTGPIRISNTMQIRARAFVPGLLPGDPRSESYIMLASSVVGFKSDLPVVILHNHAGGPVPSTGEQFVMMHIFEPRAGVTSMTNAPDMTERARFRLRGSSTQGYPKGSFALETWDEFGDDKKVSILGMPEESDWVFYAPNNFEPALIHNPLMHQLSRDIGRYSSRTRFVEVYLNTSGGSIQAAHYNGIYVIEEKIKRGADRVDVENLEPEHLAAPEVTGGYLLKIDRPDPNDANFTEAGQGMLAFVDPKGEEIRTAARDPQEQYIRKYIRDFGIALNGVNFRHPTLGYAAYLDVPAAIDHHVLNVLANNVDALRLSTYLHKPRHGKLTFGPLWDFDRALGSTDGRDANPSAWFGSGGTEYFTYTWWNRLFQDLDFWQKWIDRWEEWRLTHLTTTNVNRLIDDLSGQVRSAQPRERSRWGVAPRGGTYNTEIAHLKNYVQTRSQWIDSQLVRPPVMNRISGPIAAGSTVTFSAANPIYYTLDGTDPRMPQGARSPAALAYSGPITVNNNVRIFARAFKAGHALGPTTTARSPWSGAVTATLVVNTPKLAITEIMYNPGKTNNTYTNEDFEFIELQNTGTTSIALNGFAFTNGVDFRFSGGSLAPGAFGLLVKNRTVFESRYGAGLPILGQYTNSLNNAGERLTLVGPLHEPVADVSYSDEWYPLSDGLGFSLVPRNGVIEPGAAGWRASTHIHGSPGQADPAPSLSFGVVISEALAHTDPPQSDFVELQNTGTSTVDISGWYLTDNYNNPKKFRIGALQLTPQQFKVFTEAELGAPATGFALSSTGDGIYLFSANAAGELTGYVHGFEFGASANGVSFGRERTSDGNEFFVPRVSVTSNAPNSAVRIGPLVVTEMMFHPLPVATFDNTRDEFIEIRNASAQTVPLFDPTHATNTWRIRGGADFDFPENVSLATGGILLVVNFDPILEPWAEAQFRSRFAVPSGVPIYGPLRGKLSNLSERISLQRPDSPDALGIEPVPYIVVDEFTYRTTPASYPFAGAAGTGDSVHRLSNSWAQEPISWLAGAPTPGVYDAGSNDNDNDGLPREWELAHGLSDSSATGDNGPDGDPDGDGLTNLQEYQIGTHPNDATSALRFIAVVKLSDTTLTMNAAADRTYSVLYSTDLAPQSWTKLRDVPAGAARTVQITDNQAATPVRFYRLVSPASP